MESSVLGFPSNVGMQGPWGRHLPLKKMYPNQTFRNSFKVSMVWYS